MKSKLLLLLPLSGAMLFAQPAAPASGRGESAVKPGQSAPPLQIAEWVKGAPLTRFEPGKVYLVEFWAVWCGPCIANIPHLNALQKKYGPEGLVVIGMTSPDLVAGDTGPRKEGNSLQMVRAFVAKRGDGMNYHVAYDAPDRATFKAFMGQRSGIPHAFLFDRAGRLVVDFHPTYLDDAIAQVIAGTWDPVSGPPKMVKANQAFVFALNAKKYETFKRNYDELASTFPGAAKRLYLLRFAHALRAGELGDLQDAGQHLIEQTRELGDPRELGAAGRNAARELSATLNSGVGGLLPGDRVRRVRGLLDQMTGVAVEASAGREPVVFAAQAELALLDGQLAKAVDLQEKAVAAMLSGAKGSDNEQKRLEELRKVLADETRRQALMKSTGRPD